QHRPGQPVRERRLHRYARHRASESRWMAAGRWMDNVFIERLWRSLKHEDIYLKGYADGRETKAGIGSWITFYNLRRPHQALGNRPPMTVWRAGVTGALGDRVVDMTLVLRTSLDTAGAFPTSPQPPQQQQQKCIA